MSGGDAAAPLVTVSISYEYMLMESEGEREVASEGGDRRLLPVFVHPMRHKKTMLKANTRHLTRGKTFFYISLWAGIINA